MNKSMPWFRMYTDFLNDPKLIGLAFEDQRHFIGVLALKCDGALDADCDPDLLNRIVAQRLWIDHAIIRDVKKRLVAAGLIDEAWQPLAWDKRQFKSDTDATAADRKRRQRAKERSEISGSCPAENSVTDTSRVTVTQVTPVTVTNVTRTDTDTDTETETEKRESVAKAPPAARGTRLPVDWKLSEDWKTEAQKIRAEWHDQHVQRVADAFRDYWIAQPGQKGVKTDWLATWRNWCRRDATQMYPGPQSSNGQSASRGNPVNGQPYDPRQDPNWRPKPMPRPGQQPQGHNA